MYASRVSAVIESSIGIAGQRPKPKEVNVPVFLGGCQYSQPYHPDLANIKRKEKDFMFLAVLGIIHLDRAGRKPSCNAVGFAIFIKNGPSQTFKVFLMDKSFTGDTKRLL